jgi:hypothetical protein
MNAGQAGEAIDQLRQQTEQQQEIDRLHTELEKANDQLQQFTATAQQLPGLAGIQPTLVPQSAPIKLPAAPTQPQQPS